MNLEPREKNVHGEHQKKKSGEEKGLLEITGGGRVLQKNAKKAAGPTRFSRGRTDRCGRYKKKGKGWEKRREA